MTGAIRQAAQATGTRFQYLLATAQVESGLDPQAGAATSSARGLFQFAEQTWPGTMKQSGAALGHGRYADAITKTTSGRYEVADPAMRREILKVRTDPMVNAVMAGAFTQANAALLSQKLGRGPSEGGALPRAFSRRRRRGAPDFACATIRAPARPRHSHCALRCRGAPANGADGDRASCIGPESRCAAARLCRCLQRCQCAQRSRHPFGSHDSDFRRFQALALGLHPAREFGRQLHQRRLGARNRIVVGIEDLRDHPAQFRAVA